MPAQLIGINYVKRNVFQNVFHHTFYGVSLCRIRQFLDKKINVRFDMESIAR